MTYQEFKDTTIRAIQMKLGKNVQVTLQDIIKNNDTHLDGLTILTTQSNLSPTIYLNQYYEQFLQGKTLSEIYTDILYIYANHAPNRNIDVSFFTDYNKVKEHIIFKLINYERNKELLEDVPFVRFLDLAMVFNCLLDTNHEGCATILIHNHHLSIWNVNTEELLTLAKINTPKLLSYCIHNMTDVIKELVPDEDCANLLIKETDFIPMYILTNNYKLHGSACIAYENLISDFAENLKSDLYILPSSVHEVILIPATSANSYAELTSMVKEVNATQIAREEILSDHVYYYSRESKKIMM